MLAALATGSAASAQELLELDCAFDGETVSEDIYAFRADERMEAEVRRVVSLVGAPTNFELQAANVPTVLAGIVGDRRLILYNTDYVYPASAPEDHSVRVLARIARAVAHHQFNHECTRALTAREVASADEFVGGTLAHLADNPGRARQLVDSGTFLAPAPTEARLRAMRAGFDDAEQLAGQTSLGYGAGDETRAPPRPKRRPAAAAPARPSMPPPAAAPEPEPRAAAPVSDTIPSFPWPPPVPSARVRLPEVPGAAVEGARMRDVAGALEAAFVTAGYGDYSYYSVPDGFAMVSRLEQIDAEGAPLDEPDRWSARVRPFTEFSLGNYLRALFTATKGRFRIIVFVVTPRPFNVGDTTVTSMEAEAWLPGGLDALPQPIGDAPVTDRTKVTALIYEFVKPTRDDEASLSKPSSLPAHVHLQRAALWKALKQ